MTEMQIVYSAVANSLFKLFKKKKKFIKLCPVKTLVFVCNNCGILCLVQTGYFCFVAYSEQNILKIYINCVHIVV